MDDKICSACDSTDLEYVCSDRHRGYYDCEQCNERVTLHYY